LIEMSRMFVTDLPLPQTPVLPTLPAL